jgi:hypothetical protein
LPSSGILSSSSGNTPSIGLSDRVVISTQLIDQTGRWDQAFRDLAAKFAGAVLKEIYFVVPPLPALWQDLQIPYPLPIAWMNPQFVVIFDSSETDSSEIENGVSAVPYVMGKVGSA